MLIVVIEIELNKELYKTKNILSLSSHSQKESPNIFWRPNRDSSQSRNIIHRAKVQKTNEKYLYCVQMSLESELLRELDNYLKTSHGEDQIDGDCMVGSLVRILNISKQLLKKYLKIQSVEENQLKQICQSLNNIVKIVNKIHTLLNKTYQNDIKPGTS